MKIDTFLLLAVFLALFKSVGLAISVDEFKAIPDEGERRIIISQAPIEQRETLKKINKHLILLQRYGGELPLQRVKESYLIQGRGLESLEGISYDHWNLWQSYFGGVEVANERDHVPQSVRIALMKYEKNMKDQWDEQIDKVHSLVLTLAASPRALELADEARVIHEDIAKRMEAIDSATSHRITRAELASFDKRIDQIFDEMEKLPALKPEEVHKAYEAISEANIR